MFAQEKPGMDEERRGEPVKISGNFLECRGSIQPMTSGFRPSGAGTTFVPANPHKVFTTKNSR